MILQFAGSAEESLDAAQLADRYLYGPAVDMLLVQEAVSNETYTTFMAGQPDGPAPTVNWMLLDNLNSVRDVIGRDWSSGGVHLFFDSFGNDTYGGSSMEPIAWTGQYHDSITGLQWNGERWYNPDIGRWMSQDPLGLGPDTNPYRYVDNAPTDETDPSGLCSPNPVSIGIAPASPGPNTNQNDTTEDAYRRGLRNNDVLDHVFDVTSPQDMFNQITGALKNCDCISTLFIGGHAGGGNGGQVIGSVYDSASQTIHTDDVSSVFGKNSPLNGKFCKHCQVLFLGCNVGTGYEGLKFLQAVADATGCEVSGYDRLVIPEIANGGLPNGPPPRTRRPGDFLPGPIDLPTF